MDSTEKKSDLVEGKTQSHLTMGDPTYDRLSSLEKLVRFDLKDSEVTLTKSGSLGTVILEMQEESVIILITRLQEQNAEKWSREKELAEKEMCSMKAQLEEACARHVCSTQENMYMHSQVLKLSEALFDIHTDFEQQTSDCIDLQAKLAEAEKQQKKRNNLIKQKEEIKTAVEQSQASYQAQMEEHQAENKKLESALQKAEDLLQSEQHCLQQERTSLLEEMDKSRASYLTQLEEQKQVNSTLVDALKTAEQGLDIYCSKWQEDKSSLLQAVEGLQKTLQQREQEWEKKENLLKSQMEELDRQIQKKKKKKKKKWYRELF